MNETNDQRYQRLINLDYSVPDYSVTRPDAKVMGWKLAGILQFLEKNYKQGIYNQMLSQIRNKQMNELVVRYLPIERIKLRSVEKHDSVITITINTFSKTNKKEKIDCDIKLVFINSISGDEIANRLFSDMGRFVK